MLQGARKRKMKKDLKEEIINTLNSELYVPMYPGELYELITRGDESLLRPFIRVLSSMEENGEIAVSKKGKILARVRNATLCGVFHASTHGAFGFVTTDAGEFFIPPKFTLGAFDGDEVRIKKFTPASRFYGKGNEAEVVSIAKRVRESFIGEFRGFSSKGKLFGEVASDDEKLSLVGYVVGSDVKGVINKDKVVCKIVKYPEFENDRILVRITENLGASDSREANYKAVLHEHMISTEFDDNVLREADLVADEKLSTRGRLDLREKTIFTIDSESAKDLDDAISIERNGNGYILGVHIADVSHYVREKSLLDKEAMSRGTSVYFTDKVVPMLPKALSNGACSLNADSDKYALSAIITLDKNGKCVSCELHNSIIRSKMRGVYAEFNDIIENGSESEFYSKYRHVLDDFDIMRELYEILKTNSIRDGMMELESDEAEIILDENSHPIDIIKRERGESERLIEQFMLCANKAVAKYCLDRKLPCVYRVHESPDMEKIHAFSLFAKNLGVDVSSINKDEVSSLDLSVVLEDAKRRGCGEVVSGVLLRSLMKAKYSSVPKIHFGLATDCYCHFTSPIRRYPDLSVHRIIKSYLDGSYTENAKRLSKFADRSAKESSENELRALYAERGIDDLYKAIYMKDRLYKEYDATICSVTSFGFFAKTDKLCEGLVPIGTLDGHFYFDESNLVLSSGKKSYRLGDRVKIKVVEADVTARRVTFALVSEGSQNEKSEHSSAPSKKPTQKSTKKKAKSSSGSKGRSGSRRYSGSKKSKRKGRRR